MPAPNSQHLRDILLGQTEFETAMQISRPQKPPGEPAFQIMRGVSGLMSRSSSRKRSNPLRATRETACECYETIKLNYDALRHASNE